MDPLWWIVASALTALMTGGLVYFVTQSNADVQLAKQREELAAARATLAAQKEAMVDSLRNAHESARRQALDDFMADIRVEERHYVREHKALFLTRKAVVRQERIFFRNLPLSNWVEQEMPFEEGADIDQLAKTMAVFIPEGLLDVAEPKPRKLLKP
jgi:multidrug efflux pump subunit AcrA (membrane-fusion protein)